MLRKWIFNRKIWIISLVFTMLFFNTYSISRANVSSVMAQGSTLFDRPVAVAINDQGMIYVADYGNSRIVVLDPVGRYVAEWGGIGSGNGQFNYPNAIAFDSHGNVYVTDRENHRIQKFDVNGNYLAQWGTMGNGDGQFINPTGIAITNNDILYVGDRDNRRIQYFDSNGNYLGKWGREGTGDGQFLQPHGLAVDAQGHVYVTDSELHRVQKFDVNGAFISKWGTQGTGDGQFRYPFSIAVDNGSGHLYVPDAQNNRIQKFDLEGNYVSQWGSAGSGDGQFNFPNSIAIDNNGHVYVTEANNHQVQKFDGDGHFLNRWSGLINTIGIVLSPKMGQLNVGGNLNFQLTETFTNGTSQDQTANTTFTVSDPTIATIQNNELTAISPGTVTVTATYGSTSDTATITVITPPVTTTGIILAPKTGQLTVGGTQTFQLVENLSNGASQDQTTHTTFTVSDPTIAKMQGNILTAIKPGTVSVTATYGSTSDTATITVNAVPIPTPTPEPIPEPVYPTELTPSRSINIIRTVEQGIVKYQADVLLDHVQALVPQLPNQETRTIRLVYPAETATTEAYLSLSRKAGVFLNKQQTNFFMQTAIAQLTMPSTSFSGMTEDVFFRIMPVTAQQQKVIQTNVLKNEHIQQAMPEPAIISLMGASVKIETNMQSRPVTITLPISAELTEEQMASLVAYIEHSDATTEVKRGRIVETEPGVKGFQFEVNHFSTFSLVYASKVQEEDAEVKRLAPYIQGYSDGTFKPNASVTRAQIATMLARFLTNGDIPATMSSSFEDTANHPSKDAIEVVKQAGLFNGTTETTFNPNGTITRAQMASVVMHWVDTGCARDPSKTICHTSGKSKPYTDVSPTHWAAIAIEQVSTWGIMTGNSETTFNPNASLTRAQAVKVLNQLFERPALEDITTSTFNDVPSPHWAFGEIEAAATERMVKQ
ncbi:S-layer homology domain-containing protein [Lysinibacillus fusiformis]|uniref:S-layer homology domain-containing protein n=1 Tax=Lysinibacillus fusiformis TaxID=28031 RepID=UPI003D067962